MRRFALALPTMAMLGCLVVYGVSGSTLKQRRAVAPATERPFQPLAPRSLGSMDPREVQALRDRRQAVAKAVQQQEAKIVAQLELSAQQMIAYSQLRQELERHLLATDNEQPLRDGLHADTKFRDGLKKILTDQQYQQYRELWDQHREVYGATRPGESVNNDDDLAGSSTAAPQAPD